MIINKFDEDLHQRLQDLWKFLEDNPKAKYKSYIFRVEPEVITYLDYLKKISGISVSQMVREGIQLYLNQLNNQMKKKIY